MTALRKVLFKVFGPILVLVGIFLALAVLPEMFPDHDVVSDAIYQGDLERVRELLDRGADPNSRSAVLSILAKGMSKTGRSSNNNFDFFSERTPLLIEAINRNEYAISRLLLERGADPNVSDGEGHSALDRARDMESPQIVTLLINRGAR
jgi:ankyrin repeat protein